MDTRARNEDGSRMGGALAGALATGTMTGVMLAAQRTGLLGQLPPDKITRRMLQRMGFRSAAYERRGGVLAALSHLGFGMAAGAVYKRFTKRLRHGGLSVGAGLTFGALVWAVSYAGWVPRLGLMPRPHRDRPGRQPTLLLAHLVYGAVLALLTRPRRV